MKFNWLSLKVSGSHSGESGSILEGNDVSTTEMEMELVRLGRKGLCYTCGSTSICREARVSDTKMNIEDVTPVTCTEVEVVGVLSNSR